MTLFKIPTSACRADEDLRVCISALLTHVKTHSLSTFHSFTLLLYITPLTRHYKDPMTGFDTHSRITGTLHGSHGTKGFKMLLYQPHAD